MQSYVRIESPSGRIESLLEKKDYAGLLKLCDQIISDEEIDDAVWREDMSKVNALIEAGIRPSKIMIVAVLYRKINMVKTLLKMEASYTVAILEAVNNEDIEMVRILIEGGIQVGPACLESAASKGNLRLVKILLAAIKSYDVNLENFGSSLKSAARNGHLDVVEFLLGEGIRSDQALFVATKNEHTKIVELLLKTGIRDDKMGAYSLRHAAEIGNTCLVSRLVAAGYRDEKALRVAVKNNHIDTVKFLLECRFRSDEAIRVAMEKPDKTLAKMLLEATIQDGN